MYILIKEFSEEDEINLYFEDTMFPLSQKCQWPVHDCFVVRIFPFVKLSNTITQFFVHLAEVALPVNIC